MTSEMMTTAVRGLNEHQPRISRGDIVLLIEPGRIIHPLGRAIVTFGNHEPIVINIMRTSNCRMRDIPLTDMSLFGCRYLHQLHDQLKKLDENIDIEDEVTVIRFELGDFE